MSLPPPLDDVVSADLDCDCAFTPYPDQAVASWHYLRRCHACQQTWYALHCPHDAQQNPCPHCDAPGFTFARSPAHGTPSLS